MVWWGGLYPTLGLPATDLGNANPRAGRLHEAAVRSYVLKKVATWMVRLVRQVVRRAAAKICVGG